MPPTAPSQQGSRAGLITALVIFVILFVTSTIFNFQSYSLYKEEKTRGALAIARLEPAATESVIANNKDVAELIGEAGKMHPPQTGIEVALQQRNKLAKLITSNAAAPVAGVEADTIRALDQVRSELKTDGAPVSLGDDNLLSDLKVLAGQISALTDALKHSRAETKTANDTATAKINELASTVKAKDAEIQAANDKVTQIQAASDQRQTGIDANVAAIKKDADDKINTSAAQLGGAQGEIGKLQQDVKHWMDLYNKLTSVLAKYRLNPSRSLLQPAGIITRVPGNNTVFINLGNGQEISPGLTFEVYDHKKGLPSLTTLNAENPDELPAGKASIEVIRIMDNTSECRIIRLAQGQQIVEGDLVLNLIYNTHTRFAFNVYGDFDLANTGQPTPGDADIIRRLITQWGGRVMDQVNVDTDFVVLGKEPVVNALPDSPTPLDQERHDKQAAALEKYLTIQSEAIHLNVPILNQNRFLYFIGYYDQAKR